MGLRFLADADLNHQIVIGVERLDPEIDFQIAMEAGLEGLPDSDVLALAAHGSSFGFAGP